MKGKLSRPQFSVIVHARLHGCICLPVLNVILRQTWNSGHSRQNEDTRVTSDVRCLISSTIFRISKVLND